MTRKILIVGGVAGGASFAARMRRLDEHAEIVMFERGEHISFANCGLPYHIGETITQRDNLIIQTPRAFKRRYNVEVRVRSEVVSVDTARKRIIVEHDGKRYEEQYDVLLLSPGSKPIRPPIPGIDHDRCMTLRNVPDMDRIKGFVDREHAKRAVVVGGGFIGLEMAENLRHRGLEVSMVEMAGQVFAPADPEMAVLLHQHLSLNGVELLLNDGVKAFEDHGDKAVDVVTASGRRLRADIVVLAIGVKPDTAFLRDSGIELSERGAVVVNDRMQTSAEGVYAVGDAIEVTDFVSGAKVHVPLAGPANRQGRIAADNVAGGDSRYGHTQGTAIVKVFDMSAAVTGMNEKTARRHGLQYLKSYTHSASNASYYPGAYPLSIKVLFAPDTGRLLGAQVFGKRGVDKRIDVLATAVRHGLTVFDLTELELAYAPPFGSAKDPVNMAGFVAQNILEKRMPVFYAEDVESIDRAHQVLLDVRSSAEHEQGAIDGSELIPVDELRRRIDELDPNKEILVYCQVGMRGYLASRILAEHGYRAKNLSGGYKTYSAARTLDYDHSYAAPVQVSSCSAPDNEHTSVQAEVDACGLQCPGPVMKLKQAVDKLNDSETVAVRATDQGFALDVPSWCLRTGNTLVSLGNENGTYRAVIRKGKSEDTCTVQPNGKSKKTMVVFSNDLDRMMAAFIIANGAAAMGSEVTLFFTFWGLNLLRKDTPVKVRKNMVERMFGVMMPRGVARTTLSKMHMGGLGTRMMQAVMKRKRVYSLPELFEQARANGIRFVACAMSMDVMGIKQEELIDGVEYGGVSYYLNEAENAAYNLFV
ncbi:MAG: pyridine nucleotide-disulfide oxidoreductase [Chitinivibrionales bacterium]|nr:pyridine nucleotide-disulfide oxidoreductase [Chitinivibrionales bacterium]